MPTLLDIAPLQQTLAAVLAGEPRSHHALTIVPILAPMQAEPAWLTLAEAGDRVRITEVSEGGSVPDLRAANLGDLPLLHLDGEQLVGAKQNRILNMTVLVAAQSEVTIPVSCVEQGRWGAPNFPSHVAPARLQSVRTETSQGHVVLPSPQSHQAVQSIGQ